MEEEGSNLSSRVINFLRANLLISALFFIGMIFLVIGLIQFLGRSEDNSIQFESGEDVKAAEDTSNQKIFIDVSGEVLRPGVYELDPDSRIQDALNKAGGLSPNADREYVSKSLNLALRISDGMKIYIPAVGEESPPSVVSNQGSMQNQGNQGGLKSVSSQASLISINSASQTELESLPGIGPVTAGKIINARPYSSIQELLEKKSVGQSVFEKIKEMISL
jgi:competence protein ComEA